MLEKREVKKSKQPINLFKKVVEIFHWPVQVLVVNVNVYGQKNYK